MASETTHLMMKNPSLTDIGIRLVVDNGEFLVGPRICFLHDRHMIGEFWLPAQIANGGVFGRMDVGK